MDQISVVIPLYNKAPHIARTLNSVLAQERLPEEIIVVDDGSTDGGGEVVKQFQDPLIRLVRQENQGVSVARNVGISLAKGDLIAFLDADDAWKPGFLKVISEMRELYPQAGIYATAYDVINPQGKRYTLNFKLLPPHCEQGLVDNLFRGEASQSVWTSAVAIPKRVFNEIGGFPVGEYKCQDLDVWIRIGIRYPVAWNNTILSTYCMDADNRVYGVKRFSHEPAFSRTVNEAIQSGLVPPEKLQDLKEYAAYWRYLVARHLISSGNKELALKIINKTRGTKMFRRQGWIWLICANFPFLFKFLRHTARSYFKIKNLFAIIAR
jgi:glycosyltransferase involved in cell wall biosynthesis